MEVVLLRKSMKARVTPRLALERGMILLMQVEVTANPSKMRRVTMPMAKYLAPGLWQ